MQADGTTSAVLRSVGLTEDRVARCAPLTGGTFNTVSRVTLTDGSDRVVKIPPPSTPGTLMGYERDLLVNETTFHACANGSAPVPRVLHSELDPAAPTGPYVIMSACPGRPWSEFAPGSLSTAEERLLRNDLGRIVARLHAVTTPDGFGYPSLAVGPLAPAWRQAFTAMTDAVLDDADTYRARLPRPTAGIRALLAAASPVLDDVARPALVHFDLWQGNLLVDGGPGARRIGGIVDGERMFWGDPVADFVSLALFANVEEDEDFLTGYAQGGGQPVVFDASVRQRLALYRCYLYLIMLVETVPRRASGEDREWAWTHVAPQLESALVDVESALRTGN
ncbi:aminoglycoside phosphotransferase family protein [Streptomyces sp. JV185]|uniref:phosphotransferase family protein n=1 Tax=Streptomyces sp. JV185 TaxID=858638 RepID=UPI002E77044A|nr:aminoglycoside phosphotransferase family protein [Streptomyces sp. JV185]MEE1771687.1 aminoglycoside phosphotransferase family protein [Streptomyces sp. JV185]